MTRHPQAPLTPNDELRAIRAALGWSQPEFAYALGTDHSQVSRWENGHAVPIKAYVLLGRLVLERRSSVPPIQPPGLRRYLEGTKTTEGTP